MDTIGKWRLACPLIIVSILGVVRSGYGQPNKSKLPDAKHRDNDIRAIESLPGCLGVRSFEREEGGDVSFIWFKNRKTANALFKSTFHLDTMEQIQQTTRKRKRRKLLKFVPKDTGPILIVVTRMSEDEKGDSTPAQYAVELYTPLSGGLSFGGRFAPKGIKIPKMRRYKNSKKKTNRGAREKSLPGSHRKRSNVAGKPIRLGCAPNVIETMRPAGRGPPTSRIIPGCIATGVSRVFERCW